MDAHFEQGGFTVFTLRKRWIHSVSFRWYTQHLTLSELHVLEENNLAIIDVETWLYWFIVFLIWEGNELQRKLVIKKKKRKKKKTSIQKL